MWKHLRAILLLPGVVTVLIPSIILYRSGTDTFDLWTERPWLRIALAIAGLASIAAGLTLMTVTIRMFASRGRGTLAPWNPTQNLVVEGVYRHVRNPMISGVFCILLGESLVFGSIPVFLWFLTFVVINGIFIPLLEEPDLRKRFGPAYDEYRRHVPRWIPRPTPWVPPGASTESKPG